MKIDNQQSTLFKSALESLPYPFYVINFDDYSIVMSNSAVHQSSFKGLKCYEQNYKRNKPCKNPEHICPLKEVKKTKKPCIVEHIHYDKDGNPQHLEIHGYPFFDKHGEVVKMIEYALDITEQEGRGTTSYLSGATSFTGF